MQLCNRIIELESLNTDENRLTCFRIAFWKGNTPIYKKDPSTKEPIRYHLEYEKTLEPKLIEAVQQSEFLKVIVKDRKIVQIH